MKKKKQDIKAGAVAPGGAFWQDIWGATSNTDTIYKDIVDSYFIGYNIVKDYLLTHTADSSTIIRYMNHEGKLVFDFAPPIPSGYILNNNRKVILCNGKRMKNSDAINLMKEIQQLKKEIQCLKKKVLL